MRETFEDEILYRVRDVVNGKLYGPMTGHDAQVVVQRKSRVDRPWIAEKIAFPAWVEAFDPVRYTVVAEDRLNELLRHEQAFRQAGLQISIEEESEAKRS